MIESIKIDYVLKIERMIFLIVYLKQNITFKALSSFIFNLKKIIILENI